MPVDPTSAQSAASRHNASLSTGPVTAEAKAAAGRNAARHGLRGTVIEVRPEERSLLADTLASLASRWQPVDAIERGLLQTLALMELKLVRLDTIEMQVLAASIEEPDGKRLPSLNTLVRYRSRLLKERWEAEYRLRTAISQRCTNEAETRAKALQNGRDQLALDERIHRQEERATARLAAEDAAATATPALNRQQRRRLEAHLRRAA
jgi:hypothetical protein